MRGGLRSKRVTFSLSIALSFIVEEKVTLLSNAINLIFGKSKYSERNIGV
jgi:hypothetical protein